MYNNQQTNMKNNKKLCLNKSNKIDNKYKLLNKMNINYMNNKLMILIILSNNKNKK